MERNIYLWIFFFLSYRFYENCKKKVDLDIRFLVSRDLRLKNVLDNYKIILEFGVSGYGSFIKIRDFNENILIVKKLKNSFTISDSCNNSCNTIKLEYIFEDDSKLTFFKNYDKQSILVYYESDNQIICNEDVTQFINEYKTIGFNTDFDLLIFLKN